MRPLVAGLHLRDHQCRRPPRGTRSASSASTCGCAVVEHRVRRVEAQPVDVVVAHPVLGVLDRPLAYPALRVVDRVAPERLVAVGEVRAERRQRLGAGTDVVVDHVEQYRRARRGARRRRTRAKPCGPAVRRVGRRRVHAVVSPAAVPGEGRDRHDLDRGHAEVAQLGQHAGSRREGSFVGERADVELVDHELLDRRAAPFLVGPLERGVIDDFATGRGPHRAARTSTDQAARATVVERVRVARHPTGRGPRSRTTRRLRAPARAARRRARASRSARSAPRPGTRPRRHPTARAPRSGRGSSFSGRALTCRAPARPPTAAGARGSSTTVDRGRRRRSATTPPRLPTSEPP